VKTTRKRLADGTVKVYRYNRDERRALTKMRERGAIRQLAQAYVASPEFRGLSATWQQAKRYYLGILEDELGWMTLSDLGRREARAEFYRVRDQYAAKPHKADKLVDTLKTLIAWAYERNRVEVNHAQGIKHFGSTKRTRTDKIWTEEHRAIVAAAFPSALHQAFQFALWSAMRQSDMCALKWSNLSADGWLTFKPSKTERSTGVLVHLPVFALTPFRELVANLSRCTEFMLTSETHAVPLTAINLRMRWRVAFAKSDMAGIDLHWHDLRGTAASMMLEAGCTEAEVASITGHVIAGDSSLAAYASRSRRLALNAYQKLDRFVTQQPQVVDLATARKPGRLSPLKR
jgi:integrase